MDESMMGIRRCGGFLCIKAGQRIPSKRFQVSRPEPIVVPYKPEIRKYIKAHVSRTSISWDSGPDMIDPATHFFVFVPVHILGRF